MECALLPEPALKQARAVRRDIREANLSPRHPVTLIWQHHLVRVRVSDARCEQRLGTNWPLPGHVERLAVVTEGAAAATDLRGDVGSANRRSGPRRSWARLSALTSPSRVNSRPRLRPRHWGVISHGGARPTPRAHQGRWRAFVRCARLGAGASRSHDELDRSCTALEAVRVYRRARASHTRCT